MGDFHYRNMSTPLKQSMPLPAAEYFENIDPQPAPVVTSEIASGHFEDDLRRMRMAAWHGADHIMVIRTTGQSHIDGLLEGTPEGIGGVPITRKQLRASRKACDLIEDEVGRPINFHSYVSGVAGPEVAVLFAEEGLTVLIKTRNTTCCTATSTPTAAMLTPVKPRRRWRELRSSKSTVHTTPTPLPGTVGRSCPSSWSSTASTACTQCW